MSHWTRRTIVFLKHRRLELRGNQTKIISIHTKDAFTFNNLQTFFQLTIPPVFNWEIRVRMHKKTIFFKIMITLLITPHNNWITSAVPHELRARRWRKLPLISTTKIKRIALRSGKIHEGLVLHMILPNRNISKQPLILHTSQVTNLIVDQSSQ